MRVKALPPIHPGNNPRDSLIMEDPPVDFNYEKDLAEGLLKLNIRDRMKIEEELHGVGSRQVEESPQFLRDRLAAFDRQLNARKEHQTDGNEVFVLRNVELTESHSSTTSTSTCYLNDPELRLRFLRCEFFDVPKAVDRMVAFLEFMRELFGDCIAHRPPQLSDFTREEELALMNSRNQYLPFRDRSGRRVLAAVGTMDHLLQLKLRYKVFMFLHWIASRDVETQQKGIVVLSVVFDEDQHTWNEIRKTMPKDLEGYADKWPKALPVRVSSLQHYYPDTPFFRLLATLYIFKTKESPFRSVYKVHFGELTEHRYKMMSYGIPIDLLPVTTSGVVKFDRQRAWVHVVRTIELDHTDHRHKEIVECPRSYDVVFRKGKSYTNNPGNAHYRELIAKHAHEHMQGDNPQKMEITKVILETIELRHGRFLEWENPTKTWVVLTDKALVRKKIAGALKQLHRKGLSKKKKKTQQHQNRQRHQEEQLANMIATAQGIAKPTKDDVPVTILDPYVDCSPLSKRQKTSNHLDLTECYNDTCFGKFFHPIAAEPGEGMLMDAGSGEFTAMVS